MQTAETHPSYTFADGAPFPWHWEELSPAAKRLLIAFHRRVSNYGYIFLGEQEWHEHSLSLPDKDQIEQLELMLRIS